jgi:hypothetical protein
MDASGYLYTIATVGMAFSGLSVPRMILRKMLGGQRTVWDSFLTQAHVGTDAGTFRRRNCRSFSLLAVSLLRP